MIRASVRVDGTCKYWTKCMAKQLHDIADGLTNETLYTNSCRCLTCKDFSFGKEIEKDDSYRD